MTFMQSTLKFCPNSTISGLLVFARANLEKLKKPLLPATLEKLENDCNTLKSHLFDESGIFYSSHRPTVYGAAKEYFHDLEGASTMKEFRCKPASTV